MKRLSIFSCVLLITACSSSDNSSEKDTDGNSSSQTYTIAFRNLTNGQPISPPVAILHADDYSAWEIGQAASVSLEHLAEGGDASFLMIDAAARPNKAADGVLLPGQILTVSVSSDDGELDHLTVAGMLVNTNDAFTGVTGLDIANLAVNQGKTVLAGVYDAGTEANSEDVNTIPGPAAGGEGFAADRDDITALVTHHGGVVTQADGYPQSALSESDRFDNPVMQVTITRTN